MSNWKGSIAQFTDKEFAFFLKYRLHEFSSHTKKQIYEELKNRNLTNEIVQELADENFVSNSGNCQRCNSNHFFTETHFEQTRYKEIEVKSDRCMVCGFNADKDTLVIENSFLNQVKKWFK